MSDRQQADLQAPNEKARRLGSTAYDAKCPTPPFEIQEERDELRQLRNRISEYEELMSKFV